MYMITQVTNTFEGCLGNLAKCLEFAQGICLIYMLDYWILFLTFQLYLRS